MNTPLGEIDIAAIFAPDTLAAIARALLLFIVSFLVLRLFVFVLRRVLRRRRGNQLSVVIPRVVNYLGLGLIISVVLLDAGVELGPVLGAAGIVGLAIGIASQASLSNIISGFLLVSEKAFAVGDVVRIGTTTAVVESIDLLSVKMRTFDNLYIRFPNEKVATSELTNITRHPIRRLDITLTVAFETDLSALAEALTTIARNHRLVLEEPEPIVLPLDYTEIGCKVLLGVWFSRTDFVTVKRDLYAAIPAALQARGIRFAVPVRLLRSDGEELSAHLLERSVPGEDRQG